VAAVKSADKLEFLGQIIDKRLNIKVEQTSRKNNFLKICCISLQFDYHERVSKFVFVKLSEAGLELL